MHDGTLNAIFFDFDDTLVSTSYATQVAYQNILNFLENAENLTVHHLELKACSKNIIENYKRELADTPDDIYKTTNPDDFRTNLWKLAVNIEVSKINISISEQELDELSSKLSSHLYKLWKDGRLNNLRFFEEENDSWLKQLRKKYDLVLITNGDSIVQREKLEILEAHKYFDHVIISGDEEHAKPHSSIFLKACNLCGVKPEECIMIGDNVKTDIIGANELGMTSVLFVHDQNKLKQNTFQDLIKQYNPNHVVHSLKTIVNGLNVTHGA